MKETPYTQSLLSPVSIPLSFQIVSPASTVTLVPPQDAEAMPPLDFSTSHFYDTALEAAHAWLPKFLCKVQLVNLCQLVVRNFSIIILLCFPELTSLAPATISYNLISVVNPLFNNTHSGFASLIQIGLIQTPWEGSVSLAYYIALQ